MTGKVILTGIMAKKRLKPKWPNAKGNPEFSLCLGDCHMTELKKISPEALREVLNCHKEWLDSDQTKGACADLSDTDLRYTDLCFDLSLADLHGSDLTGARLGRLFLKFLEGADLWGANLENVKLNNADLRGVNLMPTKIAGSQLHGADLRWVMLEDSLLRRAADHGARLGFFNKLRLSWMKPKPAAQNLG